MNGLIEQTFIRVEVQYTLKVIGIGSSQKRNVRHTEHSQIRKEIDRLDHETVIKLKKKKEETSFTQYEKTCEDHISNESRMCFCDKLGKLCNRMNCPMFNTPQEE